MLKHKTNGMAPQAGQRMVVQLGCFFAVDDQLARSGSVKQANDVEQCAFARA